MLKNVDGEKYFYYTTNDNNIGIAVYEKIFLNRYIKKILSNIDNGLYNYDFFTIGNKKGLQSTFVIAGKIPVDKHISYLTFEFQGKEIKEFPEDDDFLYVYKIQYNKGEWASPPEIRFFDAYGSDITEELLR